MMDTPQMPKFSEHVLLIDANFADSVAYDFKVNLALKVKRELPDVDLPEFMMCCALDGGLQPGDNEVMALLVCHKGETKMGHIMPQNIKEEIDGMAFNEPQYGEFMCSVLEEPEDELLGGESLLSQVAKLVLASQDVKSLTIVCDWQEEAEELISVVTDAAKEHKEGGRPPMTVALVCDHPDEEHDQYNVLHIGYAIMHCLAVQIDELQ